MSPSHNQLDSSFHSDYSLTKILSSNSQSNSSFKSGHPDYLQAKILPNQCLIAHFMPGHPDYLQSKILSRDSQFDSSFYARSFRLLTS